MQWPRHALRRCAPQAIGRKRSVMDFTFNDNHKMVARTVYDLSLIHISSIRTSASATLSSGVRSVAWRMANMGKPGGRVSVDNVVEWLRKLSHWACLCSSRAAEGTFSVSVR